MENAGSGSDLQGATTSCSLNDIVEFDRETVVTFGVFDGIHLGHQAVIKTLLRRATHDNLMSVLVGFLPAPTCLPCPGTMSASPDPPLQARGNTSTIWH